MGKLRPAQCMMTIFCSAVPVSLFGDSFSLEVAGSFVPVW